MKTLPNVLALVLLFLLNACTLPVDGTTDDQDMNPLTQEQFHKMGVGDQSYRWGTRPENWGQGRQFNPGDLALDQPAGLGNVDAPKIWRVPKVQNLALYAEPKFVNANNFILRWVLQAGIGGGSSKLEIDAFRFQQVAISAATMNVALVVRATDPSQPVDLSDLQINAGYYEADGNTSTNLARFTQFFSVPAGQTILVPIPNGASAWQAFGTTAEVNNANIFYQVIQAGSALILDGYHGNELTPSHVAGDFIPLPGMPDHIQIVSTSGGELHGVICFQMEL